MMMSNATLRVKSRVPLKGWALAGLITLLSLVNSLMQVAVAPVRGEDVPKIASEPLSYRYSATGFLTLLPPRSG